MKKILLAALAALPLAGCVVYPVGPAGYSAGAYAGYDPGYDFGYQGYQSTASGYGESRPAPQAYYQPQAYYPAHQPCCAPQPGYAPSYYSTYYCPPGF